MCTLPLFALLRRMAEPTPFLPPFFHPPEISSFWGLQLLSPPIGLKRYVQPSWGKVFVWVISSDLLPLNDSDLPFLLHRLSSSRSSPNISFLPSLSPFPAPGRCFRTWVLISYQFFYLSLSLRSFTPTSFPLSSIFRKLAGMTLPSTLNLTILLQRNTRFFLFPLLLLS